LTVFHCALRALRSPLLNGKGSSSKPRPDCFGPFAVRADLGASRFGPSYLGRDPSTNARVVIRTFELSREWREFGDLSDLLSAFRKLCETTIDHSRLARPLAYGAEGDIPYLVYSELAGTAMDAVLRQEGPRPVAEVLQRTRQLADAVDCAARAGVQHGLMAPCDVILESERTGITGFGLAQALIKVGIPAEAGSPYGSPQRLAGAPPTLADDIYSLAAIALELLIGTPRDPDEETSRALREAQGLPERRRIQRPAPHETRVFTTIAGVDAGKLRASFAAAFCEEPSERPSTAAEFVASFEDAVSNRRVTDEPAPTVVAVPLVSDERDEPRSAPVLDTRRADAGATPEPTVRQEPIEAEGRAARRRRARARRRERLATSQALNRDSQEHEPRESHFESRMARPEPIVDDALLAEVTPPLARSTHEASSGMSGQPTSRFLVVAVAVAMSFGAGFGGGFAVGQGSRPSTESRDVSHNESLAAPRPARAAAEDPQPIAPPPTPAVAPVVEEKVSRSEPIAATEARQRALPAVESGRLAVRSTPAGAGVVVDGQSRGVTPLTLGELAFGAHTIEVSHPGHDTRRRRVTLSERRPARSVAFELRPTSVPAPATTATASTGSLQVASRPSGAQVFVDDDLIGTTPLLLSNVAAGSRRLRVELSGYRMWTTSVQIEPRARVRVSASLEP
jgi:serine/threonine protein kinase